MAVKLSPLAGAGWQFFDNLGIPLAGGLLYTYTAGTTTPQATYTSSAGTIASANPIVLDAAGRTANEVWLTVGVAYKFVLQTPAAVTIGTYDNVSGINDLTGASFAPTTGSTSITTLGTITTGTWNATPIGVVYGGTGLTSISARSIPVANVANTYTTVTPAAGQSVRINAGNTAWEAYTPSTATDSCKAWVNFNGASPGTIRASLNVSSITYNATGDYTINFTTALQDANYAPAGICNSASTNTTQQILNIAASSYSSSPTLKTASQIRVYVGFASLTDNAEINVAFFR
jgi:hypothetical protein